MTNKATLSLARRLFGTPTTADIVESRDAYRAEDARIRAEFAAQETREGDKWCARHGASRDEWIALRNLDDQLREKRGGV